MNLSGTSTGYLDNKMYSSLNYVRIYSFSAMSRPNRKIQTATVPLTDTETQLVHLPSHIPVDYTSTVSLKLCTNGKIPEPRTEENLLP